MATHMLRPENSSGRSVRTPELSWRVISLIFRLGSRVAHEVGNCKHLCRPAEGGCAWCFTAA